MRWCRDGWRKVVDGGDALLMGSALSCCDPAAAVWTVRQSLLIRGGLEWLSEASVILRRAGDAAFAR